MIIGPMTLRAGLLLLVAVPFCGRPAAAQQLCGGVNHYRWKEKVEAPGSHAKADTVTINEILDNWKRPSLRKSPFCAAREPDEKKRYVVAGYLWRVKDSDDDGDYHLELTQSRDSFSTRCLIAEIPPAKTSAGYQRVRTALEEIIGGPVGGTKDFKDKPVHVRITGVAFWDGWHAGATRPSGHGRCNARGIGVWEIHPVTKISRIK